MTDEKPLIVDDRGYFWWANVTVPDRHFAPDDAVTGTLSVRADGWTNLDLDAPLPRVGGAIKALADAANQTQELPQIRGILAGSNRSVLLSSVRSAGGTFSTGGPSTEKYCALRAIVGQSPFDVSDAERQVRSIRVSLAGFDEWLRLGNIVYEHNGIAIKATYEEQPSARYELEDGTIELSFDIKRPALSGRRPRLELQEAVFLTFNPKLPMSVDQALIWWARIEDLLVLLTNAERTLEWPTVFLGRTFTPATVYRAQGRRPEAEVRWSECWTNFVGLRECFGTVVENWLAMHEQYGPGFHLYLGTRRGAQLYAEHHFMNLIWGLESLHRRGFPVSEPKGLASKLDRVLMQIKSSRDRRWLAGRLKHAGEPDLATRLYALFQTGPMRLELSTLREFCEQCARLRNDISHFGGIREDGSYTDLVRNLQRLVYALDILYHSIILQMVAVPKEHLLPSLEQGPQSYSIERIFDAVGLRWLKYIAEA